MMRRLHAAHAAALRWGARQGLAGPRTAWLLGVAALAALPLLSTDDTVLSYADLFLIDGIAVLGLSLQQGLAGIVSLGPGATVGVGAYTAAILSHHARWPMPLPLLVALAVTPACALLFGGAAVVLGRLHFAMVSLYAALLVPVVAEHGGFLTGGAGGLTDLEPAEVAGWRPVGVTLYLVLAGLLLVAAAMAGYTARGRWGRAFVAVREDDTSASAVGISPTAARLRVVVLAAGYGVASGALFAHAWPGTCPSGYTGATCVISPGSFGIDLSVLLFAAVTIGGRGSRGGPLAALALLVAVRWYFDTHDTISGDWQTVIYGVLLVATVVALPGGVAVLGRLARPAAAPALPPVRSTGTLPSRRRAGKALSVQAVSARFGSAVALDGVDLVVAAGEIHGLVGPNGSGKTTLINCITGVHEVSAGRIALDGRVLPSLSPRRAHRRARLGIARTFQTPRLLPDLDLVENVMQGLFLEARRSPLDLVRPPRRRSEAALRARAMEVLRSVGLANRAHLPASDLAHGDRRLAEVARALAGDPAVLLLDEPAAGLDADAVEQLRELLVAARGWGPAIVLVDHDLDLVLDVANRVTVLDHGRVVSSGPPDTVAADPAVAAAFMHRSS